jgi:hypothetical protein
MYRLRSSLRLLPVLAAATLASPAAADDRDAFSAKPVPPNIMWLVDNSGSMDNLPCTEFPDGPCFATADRSPQTETTNDVTLGPIGRSVTICRSAFYDSLGYNKNVTYPYPDPDFTTGANELYPPGKVYEKDNWGNTSTSIASYCGGFSDCSQKARCVYAMTKYGYYYETASCPGAGDPSGLCATAPVPRACTALPLADVGATCASAALCDCGICSGGGTKHCQECANNADCGGSNTCVTTGGINHCQAPAVGTSSPPRMSGNLLRLYPPKFVGAGAPLKGLVGVAAPPHAHPPHRHGVNL